METKTPRYLTGYSVLLSAALGAVYLATGLWILAAFAVTAAVLTGVAVWLER